MAELTCPDPGTAAAGCCSLAAQETWCEPSEKAACCGGGFAVSDVVADPDIDDTTRSDLAQYVGCVAGALTGDEFRTALADAGLVDVEIRHTHRVHAHAGSAIVRARKPG